MEPDSDSVFFDNDFKDFNDFQRNQARIHVFVDHAFARKSLKSVKSWSKNKESEPGSSEIIEIFVV